MYLHNLGNHKKPKTPKEWGKVNSKSYQFIKSIFSEKQSIAYANSLINLNKWYLNNPEPEILNFTKVKRTRNNLWAYYKTQGYFESTVNYKIQRDSVSKKAKVSYYINKGKPNTLDTINIKIESKVLDSIYRNLKVKSLLKTGDQYKDQTFRNEARNVVKLFRNNGVYDFNESALSFYLEDSVKTDFKTNVGLYYFI